jgi:hypothetical protein
MADRPLAHQAGAKSFPARDMPAGQPERLSLSGSMSSSGRMEIGGDAQSRLKMNALPPFFQSHINR